MADNDDYLTAKLDVSAISGGELPGSPLTKDTDSAAP
jgi:hypothetical protein